MKKISTLLLALTLVLSVTAAPVAFSPEKKHAPAKKELVKRNINKADLAGLQIEKKQHLAFQAPKAKQAAAPIRKAAQDFRTPAYAQAWYYGSWEDLYDMPQYGARGDWELYLYDAQFAFVGFVSINVDSAKIVCDKAGVTFEKVVFAAGDSATCTGSLKIEGLRWEGDIPVYKFTIDAVDENSRPWQTESEVQVAAYDEFWVEYYQYRYSLDEETAMSYAGITMIDIEVEESGITLDLEFDCYEREIYNSSTWQSTDFTAKNDTFGISLSILSANLEKTTYQQEALYLDDTYLIDYRGAEPVKILFDAISADVEFSDNGDTIYVNIEEALTKEGDRANIMLKYFTPSAQRTVDLGEFNGEVYDQTAAQYPYFIISAASSDSTKLITVSINSDQILGSYTEEEIDHDADYYGYYYTTVTIINGSDTTLAKKFYIASAEIIRDQPTVAKATISLLDENLVEYDAVIYFDIAHEATGTIIPVEIDEIPTIFYGNDYYTGYTYKKYFIVSNADDEYSISAMVIADTIENDTTYALGSFYKPFTSLTHFNGTIDTTTFHVGDVTLNADLSANGDTTYFKIDYQAFETGDTYRVTFKYFIPEANDTVRFVAEKGQSVDFVYSSGEAFIQAKKSAPADSIYLVSLYFSGINDLYGTFTANDLYQGDYSIAHVDGTDTTKVLFLTADIQISSVNDTVAHATVYAQGRDDVIYDFSFDFAVRDNFGDDSENALNLTFAHDQFMLSSTTPYDTLSAYDGTYTLSARFLTNAATLANGTYTIDDVLAYNHISASHGSVLFYDETYGMYTDFTGAFVVKNLNFYTYAYEEVWYLQSGTATVTDTQIVIAAVNSKGNEVNITINRQEETALEELLLNGAAPRKLIDNGRVVIIRDGKAFGIDGRRIR